MLVRPDCCGRNRPFPMPCRSRRRFALAVCSSVVGLMTTGCGTILYPERRGQPKGRLDWGVAVLDGLCLLLFFVPGVIAFAVDFATGAIYLPPEPYSGPLGFRAPGSRRLTVRHVPPDELSDERMMAVASAHVGREIRWDEAHCRRLPLRNLDQFWPLTDRLIAEERAAARSNVLRAQSR